MGKLTVAELRAINKPGRYADGDTLFLYVAPGGTKSWVQRLTINGRRRDIGLGGWPVVKLAVARDKAIDNRRLARSGGDPIAARRRASVPTFRQATASTVEGLAPTWRNVKHSVSWSQTLEKHAFPVLADMRVDQIERKHVLSVLTPIWNRKSETARRVRQRIRMVLSWCQAQGFIDINMAGEVISGALPRMRGSQAHFTALPYQGMAQALRIIDDGVGSLNAKLCLRFTVLTATRGKEAREARWDEMDVENRIWCIPAERTKTSVEHRQPLSHAALAVLERARALDDGSGLVFPSPRRRGEPFSNVAMMVVIKRNGLGGRMTMHGCRATFRTWASECTDANHAVMEMSIGHLVGTKVQRAYDRSELRDKRFALMEEWGSYVAPALDESPDPGVVDGDPDPAPVKPKRRIRARPRAKSSQKLPLGAGPAPPEPVARGSTRSDRAGPVALGPKSTDRGEPVARASKRGGRAKHSACSSQILQLGLFDDSSAD